MIKIRFSYIKGSHRRHDSPRSNEREDVEKFDVGEFRRRLRGTGSGIGVADDGALCHGESAPATTKRLLRLRRSVIAEWTHASEECVEGGREGGWEGGRREGGRREGGRE